MPKLAAVSSNIQAINNLGLGTKGQNLIGQIATITSAVSGVTTLDAASANSKSQPALYSQIQTTDILNIGTEFNGIGNLSVQIDASMTVAAQLANNSSMTTQSQSTIVAVNQQLDNIIMGFSDWMYGILRLVNNLNDQKKVYMIILIVFIAVIVLVYFVMVYVVY
jgi:hypothetical protein